MLRTGCGRGGNEQAFAGSQLDFQRRAAAEHRGGVPRLRKIVEREQMPRKVERRIDIAERAATHGEDLITLKLAFCFVFPMRARFRRAGA